MLRGRRIDEKNPLFDEYLSAGMGLPDNPKSKLMGLLNAILKWDPTRGVGFATYAFKAIKNAISTIESSNTKGVFPLYVSVFAEFIASDELTSKDRTSLYKAMGEEECPVVFALEDIRKTIEEKCHEKSAKGFKTFLYDLRKTLGHAHPVTTTFRTPNLRDYQASSGDGVPDILKNHPARNAEPTGSRSDGLFFAEQFKEALQSANLSDYVKTGLQFAIDHILEHHKRATRGQVLMRIKDQHPDIAISNTTITSHLVDGFRQTLTTMPSQLENMGYHIDRNFPINNLIANGTAVRTPRSR